MQQYKQKRLEVVYSDKFKDGYSFLDMVSELTAQEAISANEYNLALRKAISDKPVEVIMAADADAAFNKYIGDDDRFQAILKELQADKELAVANSDLKGFTERIEEAYKGKFKDGYTFTDMMKETIADMVANKEINGLSEAGNNKIQPEFVKAMIEKRKEVAKNASLPKLKK